MENLKNLRTFAMKGPGGIDMETSAANMAKAWSNLRARLHYQHGLSWYDAENYDHRDLHEVR